MPAQLDICSDILQQGIRIIVIQMHIKRLAIFIRSSVFVLHFISLLSIIICSYPLLIQPFHFRFSFYSHARIAIHLVLVFYSRKLN